MKVEKLDYHRNGICGRGFYVGIVSDGKNRLLVIRFPREDDRKVDAVLCAAFDLTKLQEENITFGENSWRGDHFSDIMDRAIANAEKVTP